MKHRRGEEQYEAMKLRIKYMYEAGNTTFLELLCSAEDMADFLNKTDFVQNVSEYDRDMLQALGGYPGGDPHGGR